MITDVMIDLETLGTLPGSGIISIGAVAFNLLEPEDQWIKFSCSPISRASCKIVGLTEDPDTLRWWDTVDPLAQEVFKKSSLGCKKMIWEALTEFSLFLPWDVNIWGNGADFDNPLLTVAYYKCGKALPWKYKNNRCYRTLKNLFPEIEAPAGTGIKHTALDDALYQTRHLVKILNFLTLDK